MGRERTKEGKIQIGVCVCNYCITPAVTLDRRRVCVDSVVGRCISVITVNLNRSTNLNKDVSYNSEN